MAIIWADGFDHWGGTAQAISGGYQAFNLNFNNTPGRPRTGNYCLTCPTFGGVIRRAFDTPLTKGGAVLAIKFNAAASSAGDPILFFQSTPADGGYDNANAIGIWAASNLSLSINRGTTGLASTPANFFTLNSWDSYELKVDASGGPGTHTVELRKNGDATTALIVTGITIPSMNYICVMGGTNIRDMDDFIVWDATGPNNNDWLGDRQCVTLFTTADGTPQNWTPNVGSAWSNLNSVPAGANYITSSTPGDVSEFQHGTMPLATASIAGIVVFASVLKTDAGVASLRIGMNKSGIVQNSPIFNPGTSYSYARYIMQTDPDGIAWTRTTLDNATIRLTREA
jgi:hypothetical protein